MITIPTSELTGTIADVLGFVDDDKNNAYRGIVIAWTGDDLKASAYDVLSGGTSTWVPGGGVELTAGEAGGPEEIFAEWGGDENDYAWRVWVGLDDAKEIVKTFKLPAKEALTPVTIETNIAQSRLIVARAKTDKRSAHTMTIETDTAQVSRVPNPEEVAESAFSQDSAQMQIGLALAAYRLGAFAAVRQWDVAAFSFGTAGGPIAVQISSRFTGFIFAAGDSQNAYAIAKSGATRGSDFLRTGTGVHLSGPVTTVEADRELLFGGDPESADLLSDPNA